MKVILGSRLDCDYRYLVWHWFAPLRLRRPPVQRSCSQADDCCSFPLRPQPLGNNLLPAGRQTPVPPVTPQRRLAPEGHIFCLSQRLSGSNQALSVLRGKKVTLVDQGDSASTVTDGQYQFTVPSSQLTNDLDLAGKHC